MMEGSRTIASEKPIDFQFTTDNSFPEDIRLLNR